MNAKNIYKNPIDREFKRFIFPGFGSDGTCYLKVRITNEAVIFFCSQLINYSGTSITNAIENILTTAIKQLERDGDLDRFQKKNWNPFARRRSAIELLEGRIAWVEYYPVEAGISNSETYALVAFDAALHPIWNYVSKSTAAEQCGVEETFLEVDPKRINYE